MTVPQDKSESIPQHASESAPIDAPRSAPRVGVAVPAAGLGVRMGGLRKPFLELVGEPVLRHALAPFLDEDRVVAVVVALAPDDAADPPAWITDLDGRVRVVAGGQTRTESVRNAIVALPDDVDIIAVHDAARPLVTRAMVSQCIDIAAEGRGAVAGCPAVDTLKRVDEQALVLDTPSRIGMWQAHTPQVFPADLLRRAYEGAGSGTDDAALVESVGGEVQMVDGGCTNIKVTRPEDIAIAEAILAARKRDA
jgi:2-C-methyl-D-erythritol 4-phosphate cytidylyltransferase